MLLTTPINAHHTHVLVPYHSEPLLQVPVRCRHTPQGRHIPWCASSSYLAEVSARVSFSRKISQSPCPPWLHCSYLICITPTFFFSPPFFLSFPSSFFFLRLLLLLHLFFLLLPFPFPLPLPTPQEILLEIM